MLEEILYTSSSFVHLFLTEIAVDENLTANLVDKIFIYSLAFLTDITNYLNSLNKSLQGQDQNVAFINMLLDLETN